MEFVNIYELYNQYIYSFAYKLTNNREQAEDLAQDTFLKAYENITQLREEKYIKLWLRRICYNSHLMSVRANSKYKEVFYEDNEAVRNEIEVSHNDNTTPSAEDEIIVSEEIKAIQNGCFLTMVHNLSEYQRIVFSLVDMFGLTTKETAEILNESESAIKSLLHRARLKLDKFFGENCSLINVNNYCKCTSWDKFVSHRERIKNEFIENREKVDDDNNNLINNQNPIDIERKLRYLYANMPDYKPSQEWYDRILSILKKYKNN